MCARSWKSDWIFWFKLNNKINRTYYKYSDWESCNICCLCA